MHNERLFACEITFYLSNASWELPFPVDWNTFFKPPALKMKVKQWEVSSILGLFMYTLAVWIPNRPSDALGEFIFASSRCVTPRLEEFNKSLVRDYDVNQFRGGNQHLFHSFIAPVHLLSFGGEEIERFHVIRNIDHTSFRNLLVVLLHKGRTVVD